MSSTKPPIDWDLLQQRLEKAHTEFLKGVAPTAEREQELLEARARELARPASGLKLDEEVLEVIRFRLAQETYAIETKWVHEVWSLRELVPVPCTPSFVLGIINVRGRIFSVIDLRRFFGLQFDHLSNLNKVLILRSAKIEVGVLADDILGLKNIVAGHMQAPLPTMAGADAGFLKGLTVDTTVVLAADKILAAPHLLVQEEVQ